MHKKKRKQWCKTHTWDVNCILQNCLFTGHFKAPYRTRYRQRKNLSSYIHPRISTHRVVGCWVLGFACMAEDGSVAGSEGLGALCLSLCLLGLWALHLCFTDDLSLCRACGCHMTVAYVCMLICFFGCVFCCFSRVLQVADLSTFLPR